MTALPGFQHQSEASFMRAIMDLAGLQNWKIAHFHDSRRQVRGRLVGDASAAGWPDLVLVRDGRMLILELKRDRGGRVSPAQREWIDALARVETATGGVVTALVVRPRDWYAIEQLLTTPSRAAA